MAGKSNTSATFFAQKKLLGKAHTSNLKVDGEEVIGSNIQAATSLLFGESIPESPSTTDYVTSSVPGSNATVEYIPFVLTALTGTTYDANDDGGGAGDDSGENLQTSGPHAYKFILPSDYETQSTSDRAGNGVFNNDRLVHESLGAIQLVPPFFSQDAPNPYIVKIYKDDGGGGIGDEIPLLDNIDWNVDYYNGILFLQDYDSNKIPAFARAFAYIGKMADEVISSGSSGGGSGDITAVIAGNGLTGGATSGDATLNIGSGTGITVNSNDIEIDDSIVATLSGSTFSGDIIAPAFSGSLTTLQDGNPYLIAGSNITLSTGSNGAITIESTGGGGGSITDAENVGTGEGIFAQEDSGTLQFKSLKAGNNVSITSDSTSVTITATVDPTAASGVNKYVKFVETDISAGTEVVFSGFDSTMLVGTGTLDVFYNGQLVTSGSSSQVLAGNADYYVYDTDGIKFAFDLVPDDIITLKETLLATGSAGTNNKFVVWDTESTLTNSRKLTAGDGISISTGSVGELTISSTVNPTLTSGVDRFASVVTSSVVSGTKYFVDGWEYGNVNRDGNLDVFYNGQLLLSGTSSEVSSGTADYTIFNDDSLTFSFDLSEDDVVSVKQTLTAAIAGTDEFFVLFSENEALENARVVTAGDGITISTANPREITISSTGIVARTKRFFDVTSSWSAGTPFHPLQEIDFSTSNYDFDNIDIFYNGQALRSGSSYDYVLQGTGSIVFDFDLLVDDFILITMF